jgi:hypothetical protein
MKRLFCLLGLVLFLLPLAGCKGTIDANLDSEKMYVKFIGITQDSRCATGVECIRAGDVSFSIEISQNGVKSPATLTITGGQNSSMAFVSQTYTLTASVTPYPTAGKTIKKGDYRLLLSVNKSGQ